MVLRLFPQRTIQQKRGSYGKILFCVGLDEFNGPVSGTPNYFSGKHHGFRLRFSQSDQSIEGLYSPHSEAETQFQQCHPTTCDLVVTVAPRDFFCVEK